MTGSRRTDRPSGRAAMKQITARTTSMRPAIRAYWDKLSIVSSYLLGRARRGARELDVSDQLVELRFERQVALHGGGAEDLAAGRCLSDAHPHATVREEEDEEESDHQQRRPHPDEVHSRVMRHDQPGELLSSLEGVSQSGNRCRLALVHDLGCNGIGLPVLVDLQLHLTRLDAVSYTHLTLPTN